MQDNDILSSTPLFVGLEGDLTALLGCLSPTEKYYEKDEIIILAGQKVTHIGVMLSGTANIIRTDIDGNSSIISHLSQSDIFGEALVCARAKQSKVTVIATALTKIMFFDYKKIITVCSSTCGFHTALIENMLHLIASKNLVLVDKMNVLSSRTIRSKILVYLKQQMLETNSLNYEIPFNKTQLSEYLCVDRSSLSRELSNMQRDGILSFDARKFTLRLTSTD